MGKRKNQKGQAGIEFIVVCVAVFFFLLFFLSMSMLFVVSEYLDYATFMAARTYKSGFSNIDYQHRYAQEVFSKYTQNVQGLARNIRLTFHDNDDPNGSHQTSGVSAKYDIDLFYLPPVFVKGADIPSTVTLTTESHLGRDPSFEDCMNYFNTFSQKFGLGLENSPILKLMDDNGC